MVNVFRSEVDRVYGIKNVSIIDEAEVENTPINVNYIKNMILFAFIAAAFVCAIIFIIYYFDNTIKSVDTVTKITDLPVLATIPKVDNKNGGKKND